MLGGFVIAVMAAPLTGCGKPSYCSKVSDLKSSVKQIKNIDPLSTGSNSFVHTFNQIEKDTKAVVSSAKSDFPSETQALSSSYSALKGTVIRSPPGRRAERPSPRSPRRSARSRTRSTTSRPRPIPSAADPRGWAFARNEGDLRVVRRLSPPTLEHVTLLADSRWRQWSHRRRVWVIRDSDRGRPVRRLLSPLRPAARAARRRARARAARSSCSSVTPGSVWEATNAPSKAASAKRASWSVAAAAGVVAEGERDLPRRRSRASARTRPTTASTLAAPRPAAGWRRR